MYRFSFFCWTSQREIQVILGWLYALETGLQSSSQDEGGNQNGSGEGGPMVDTIIAIMHSNMLAFRLPKNPSPYVVDGWNPARKPVEVGSFSQYF